MVFPSVPLYLDPPNWNQSSGAGGSAGQAGPPPRANSMAERARLAKIPQPEPALKCPRCDSTNTKFCYFNNYSLSQPRHFCKACRRYWTRGGALRSVPVGGGCRRNKRGKSSAAKSSAGPTAPVPPPAPAPTQLFNHAMDYGGSAPNLGLGFHGMDHYNLTQFHHQFPFLGALEPQLPPPQPLPVPGLFPFDGQDQAGKSTVKMEDASRGQYQLWGGAAGSSADVGGGWMPDISGFNSSL